jgi:hypothetical protein
MHYRKRILLTTLLSFGILLAEAQEERFIGDPTWTILSKVTYKMVSDQFGEMSIPEFSSKIKEMDGKEIELTGYMVPLDGLNGVFNPDHFILSSLPLNACFFCGVGGPESVAEIYMEEPIKYTTDPITLKGTLKLNYNDPYQLMYLVDNTVFKGVVN